MKKITHKEWMEEGKKRFGDNIKQWKFKCPRCGTVQTAQDLLDAGITKDKVEGFIAFSCIGRFNGKETGCDWTLGGFLQIHNLVVTLEEDGKTHERPTFEFAEEAQ